MDIDIEDILEKNIDLINFVLITLFSLLIGLSLRTLHPDRDASSQFGTDRTFTFIGIWGYILYIIQPNSAIYFTVGGIILSMFLGINYYFKISNFKNFGLTTIIIALITYSLAPLIYTQERWLFLLIVVTVLAFTELKESFVEISKKIERNEFITLAKFIAIAGVILPILPDEIYLPYVSISPYEIWLAVVVISSISYLSYLLKKFVFKESGTILTGILGGLYSSTATTVILARKSRENKEFSAQYAASIILATSMMYLRILVLILIFNLELFRLVYLYFLILTGFSILTGIGIFYFKRYDKKQNSTFQIDHNPLEFRIAIIFTILFIAFSYITNYTLNNFGAIGMNLLSYLVGVTDIDPFLINLFQGKLDLSIGIVSILTMQAMISNNFLKLIYGLSLAEKKVRTPLLIGFLAIIAVNVIILLILR